MWEENDSVKAADGILVYVDAKNQHLKPILKTHVRSFVYISLFPIELY